MIKRIAILACLLFFAATAAFGETRIDGGKVDTYRKIYIEKLLGIREGGTSPQYFSYFQGGDQSGDLTWTWPAAFPGANNYPLISSTAGVFTWNDQALLTTSSPLFKALELTGGNITYVPIDGDINTYENAASDGDTLLLASGTYTIDMAHQISVGKSVNIKGQGIGKTILYCSDAGAMPLLIAANNVRVSDLTINLTSGGDGWAIAVWTSYTGAVIENVEIDLTYNASNPLKGIYFNKSSGTVKNCKISITNNHNAYGIVLNTDTTQRTVNVYNTYINVSSTAGYQNYGVYVDKVSNGNGYIYLYNCDIRAGEGTYGYGLSVDFSSYCHILAYNCVISGSGTDVDGDSSAETVLSNCVLLNNTTDGTITYTGTSTAMARDSDKLDGQHGSYYQTADATLTALAALDATAGILKQTGEDTFTKITDNSSNWDMAYGWGDHASAGYFIKATDDLDDISAGVTNVHLTTTLKSNYDTAYGWGDHSAAGYMASSFLSIGSLADPNADTLMGWDDTDGAVKFITIGTNLSYDHATHTLSASGGGGGGKHTVEVKTDNYDVLTTDVAKTLGMNSASDKAFNLPSVAVGDVGTWYTFVKLGAGKVTIDAADSDTIADSSAGGTIYDNQASETYATISLELVTETKWVVREAHGTWVTT